MCVCVCFPQLLVQRLSPGFDLGSQHNEVENANDRSSESVLNQAARDLEELSAWVTRKRKQSHQLQDISTEEQVDDLLDRAVHMARLV